uniref:Putative ixostatin n=1 Tax=Ixodes ricinus TaxID=34613 RepID=A0A0K8RIR6_IXORI
MLPITCLTEPKTSLDGCTNLRFDSFQSTGNKTTLSTVLGRYCNASYIDKKWPGSWFGMAGAGTQICRICCINKFENGTFIYKSTNAPTTFPCGGKKKCNRRGRCVRQSQKRKGSM